MTTFDEFLLTKARCERLWQGQNRPDSAETASGVLGRIFQDANEASKHASAGNTHMLLCAMDRKLLLRHLAEAERHVAEGEDHIARQRDLIAELEGSGQDTSSAKES